MTDPATASAKFQEAVVHLHAGRAAEAETLLNKILESNPDHADTNHLLGYLAGQRGQFDAAKLLITRAIAANPNAVYCYNLAMILCKGSRLEEALTAFDHALELDQSHAEIHNSRADVLNQLGRFDEALGSYETAIQLQPGNAIAHNNLASTLNSLGRFQEAVSGYQKAIKLDPEYAAAYYNCAIALDNLKRDTEALAAYDRAISLNPDFSSAHYNRGLTLARLGQLEQAVSAYDCAIRIRPDFPEAHNNRGNALRKLGRLQDAITAYAQATRINPNHAEAHNNRANVLRGINRIADAIEGYRHAFSANPNHLYAFSNYVDTILRICDWSNLSAIHNQVHERIATGQSVDPFLALYLPVSGDEHLACARRFIKARFPVMPEPAWKGQIYRHKKVRIAYLSADFHSHATAYLMMDLFENHDRQKFEVIGISFGPDDNSTYRSRLQQAFDHFLDVRELDDAAVASRMIEMEIDIAIDLKGFTQDARPGIFAHRAAPIQVNYLGYPGTMGADFIDYIIVDQMLVPENQQAAFSEQLVYLPDSYQANDSKRKIAEDTPSRAECGLPEEGFIFCCFNNNLKITPEFFTVWMNLLKAVPGSVLWLLQDSELVENNLRKEARLRNVNPERIVFARRTGVDEHLARQRLADLFLDTLPCNAHTTASDALWAGLPVLTCSGKTFAGRVARSLLNAIGLNELITENIDEYATLALQLATNTGKLEAVTSKLAKNRLTSPLFDSARFRQNIEQAYIEMWNIWQNGEQPRMITCTPLHQTSCKT